ncbi:hypothetical protein FA13DRAFT_392752 [Coprinellus micaceus]|uniref:SMP-LTD domain-containing protein n=1 Tax=Coprinellus micaceus TaxID=71717 RepID=A0A4Y7TWZ8_COPMI|nr:hypothetical protein FA13DRAFT_392752 [Coprinellus micaceus]
MFRALLYAYVLGGLTFIPLLIGVAIFITIYTSVPVGDPDSTKEKRRQLEKSSVEDEKEGEEAPREDAQPGPHLDTNDLPTTRKGWMTMRRTFEETEDNTSYVTLVRSFLDSRSKDPKRSRPKDMWYVVLKRNILYLYEDEAMTECGAVIELGRHEVVIYPEGLPDGELFAKRNAICLRQKQEGSPNIASVTREMKMRKEDTEAKLERASSTSSKEREALAEAERKKDQARDQAFDPSTPWFMFVSSNVEMEDWYLSLQHAATQPPQTPTLLPLRSVFDPRDMNHLVSTLDDQPDVIPMRWLNALLGRIFFSHYLTHNLEAYIIGRIMKKIDKVKRPQFLTSIAVTEVSVGNRPPMLSKPMLKELSKEGDASLEVHFQYKGEIRLRVEATAVINLGARFKSYTVKLVLAVVLKELEGNLLVKVKRPPSNRIWYAFTRTPRMVLAVEPIVSDRQITWGMILSTIESKIKEVIEESVVMPNMDDIAYFDSLPYELRGGIWADASRQAHPHTFQPTPPDIEADGLSTASAPLPSTFTPEPPAVQASQSEAVLATTSEPESSPEPTVPDVVVDDTSDSSQNDTRVKTWFSSVRSDDGKSSSAPDILIPPTNDGPEDEYRGRSLDSDGESSRRGSRSRQTSVHSTRSTRSIKSTSAQSQRAPEVNSLRRSLSRHFNFDKDEPSSSDGRHSRRNSTTTPQRKQTDESQTGRSPSPVSFFSTLKSKAGDKQALTNTAKETMRKWGMNVNWGLKKDNASGSEDSSDIASSPSRLGVGQDASQGHKHRASYAEVRAAVAERKEREKPSDQSASRPTSPLPPFDGAGASTSNTASNSATTLTPGLSHIGDNAVNPSIMAAAARLSTPRLTTKKSTPSMGHVNTDIDAEADPPPGTPIKAQPQAKVMAIPGIHARHRGEIQALGHVAETPSPTPAPVPSRTLTTLESKLKNPTIQTVYRFWRSPSISMSGSNQSSETASQDQVAPATSGSSSTSDSSTAVAPSTQVEDDTSKVDDSHFPLDATNNRRTTHTSPSPTSIQPHPYGWEFFGINLRLYSFHT